MKDHAPMLWRHFLSMREYSQQDFEASHKDQHQLCLKVSSHDQRGEASSSKLSVLFFYEKMVIHISY